MNKQTTEELKAIVDGAPKTNAAYAGLNDVYYDSKFGTLLPCGSWDWKNTTPQVEIHNISDLAEIIALRESKAELENIAALLCHDQGARENDKGDNLWCEYLENHK